MQRLFELDHRRRADQHIHAFERLQPSHKQGQWPRWQIQRQPCRHPIPGVEPGEIYPAGNNANVCGVRAVQLHQEISLVGRRADHPIGATHDLALSGNACCWLTLRPPRTVFHFPQRVKHGDVRTVPSFS